FSLPSRHPLLCPLFPYTTLFRSRILRPLRLVVELTEDTPDQNWPNSQLVPLIKDFIDYGMDFSLDDCGTGVNQLENIKELVPLRSEEHTSELQSRFDLVCRLLLE